ncbi:protein TIS11 isoform X1 [Atheta coriaria]|uniref:protein TIS11 isoform X1 n=1 Tax=Dalotia coriaria TaxID=877792 RepID=UPI0031F436E2
MDAKMESASSSSSAALYMNFMMKLPAMPDVTQLDILRSLIAQTTDDNRQFSDVSSNNQANENEVTIEEIQESHAATSDGSVHENYGIPETAPGAHLRCTLTRMASSPAQPTNAATLVSSLLGNLSQQHRRLERTQSAPAPASALPASAASAVNTSRYKTELCRPYEEFGVCKYGDKCQFAHGMNELRNLARHPKYKTELCRTYHTVGFCPYGPRCHFVHNQEEVMQQNTRAPSAASMMASSRATPMQMSRGGARPAALSPALSIDSASASSPPCSLSQSPTSSMGSFFSSEPELHSPGIEEQRLPVFNMLAGPGPQLLTHADLL